ncbi:hypothetical protein [Peribacillus glennii]|uniref:Uncharacterized protein n=1 Tax=Peribacillus glennii TaxID=2303991 RepID=A0A372L847_9BACI|nr:hypothetical protein [Peribacillus glennii]RFU61202.1 hypothetical protein D0466_18430 [Peribacillus glennii]
MFKRNKTEVVGTISNFMAHKDPKPTNSRFQYTEEVRESLGVLGALSVIPLAIKPLFTEKVAFAAEAYPVAGSATAATNAMYDKMLHAFDPLITLVQALAYPVAMVVVLGGALFIMIGNREKGFGMMSGAGLGYALVQMTPLALNILVEAMKAI